MNRLQHESWSNPPPAAQDPSVNYDTKLLNEMCSIYPTDSNRHMAFRLLLNAESDIRRLLPPVSTSANGPLGYSAAPLTVAKLTLMTILKPAWHPILDECEQQLSIGTVAPEDGQMSIETSSPLAGAVDYSSSSIVYPDVGSGKKSPAQSSTVQDEESPASSGLISPYSSAGEVTSDSPSIGSFEQSRPPASTYSSLLPEWHCPPFANPVPYHLESSSQIATGPSFSYTTSTASTYRDFFSSDLNGKAFFFSDCLPTDESQECSSHPSRSSSVCSRDLIAVSNPGLDHTMDLSEAAYWPQMSVATNSYDQIRASTKSGSGYSDSSYEETSPPDVTSKTPKSHIKASTDKHKRRIFDRPPGMPLGPWTPNDKTPFPEAILPKKPRKVRRAPSNKSASSLQHGRAGDKVLCPECDALLLPKSLNRHRERHSNWTEGEYNAHLYCRYCFSAYSRMDSLIHHQRTDAQCVLLQYKIYWKERRPYLEQSFRKWTATASLPRQVT